MALGLLLSANAYAQECIKGNCDNGYGIFIYSKVDKYDGEWKNGMFNGKGTLTSEIGTLVANWINNIPTGSVILPHTMEISILEK